MRQATLISKERRQLSIVFPQLSEAEKSLLGVSVFLNGHAYSISGYISLHDASQHSPRLGVRGRSTRNAPVGSI